MILRRVLITTFVSQTAWPILYILSSSTLMENPVITCTTGLVIIPTFGYLLYRLLPSNFVDTNGIQRKRNFFYYMFCLLAWLGTFSLAGALEASNYIKGFVGFYLENGEPYLASPFGIYIQLWDGTVRFIIYLMMIYKVDNGQDCTKIGHYWAGEVLGGIFCVDIGALVGSYSETIHSSILFTIPYIVLPLYALHYWNREMPVIARAMPRTRSFTDSILFLGLLLSMAHVFVAGLAALGSPLSFVQNYVNEYEPYILEPGKFGTMHCLFNFVYCLPMQTILAYYLVKGNGSAMTENLSLVLAGALAHGSFFHVLAQFHPKTPAKYQTSNNPEMVVLINIFPVLIAHLLMYKFNAGNSTGNDVKSKKYE